MIIASTAPPPMVSRIVRTV